MNIKLDENLPMGLREVLGWRGHDVDTVADEGLCGRLDPDIWAAAQAAGRFFITQDLDFSDIRQFEPGTHHGLLLLRLHQPSRRFLLQRVHALFADEHVETWQGCFVVATETKVRVRTPAL